MYAVRLQEWTTFAVLAAWFSFAAIFLFRRRPPASPETSRDPMGTVGILLQGVGFGVIWSLRRPPGAPLFEASLPVHILVTAVLAAVTVALAAGSVALTLWSVRTLGRQWALAARLVEGHELVTGGPYQYVRNPIYAGLLGMLLATGIAWSRPLAIVLGTLVFCAGTVVRIRAEERLLRNAFGESWEAWAGRTPALVPGIW
jgi:protein-S-isoprenylcysteine O-methyltransferase Ste14